MFNLHVSSINWILYKKPCTLMCFVIFELNDMSLFSIIMVLLSSWKNLLLYTVNYWDRMKWLLHNTILKTWYAPTMYPYVEIFTLIFCFRDEIPQSYSFGKFTLVVRKKTIIYMYLLDLVPMSPLTLLLPKYDHYYCSYRYNHHSLYPR